MGESAAEQRRPLFSLAESLSAGDCCGQFSGSVKPSSAVFEPSSPLFVRFRGSPAVRARTALKPRLQLPHANEATGRTGMRRGVPPALEDRLMTREQAATALASSLSHVKELIRTNELRTVKYLKRTFVVKASVTEYLAEALPG
jgi:hypothetical protein